MKSIPKLLIAMAVATAVGSKAASSVDPASAAASLNADAAEPVLPEIPPEEAPDILIPRGWWINKGKGGGGGSAQVFPPGYVPSPGEVDNGVEHATDVNTYFQGASRIQVDPRTFDRLEHFAKLISIAYCIGRNGGMFPGSNWVCPRWFCYEFTRMELVQVFTDAGHLGTYSPSGYLALDHYNKHIVLAIRGASTPRDFMAVWSAQKVPLSQPNGGTLGQLSRSCPSCRVHSGFYNGYVAAYNQIAVNLNRVMSQHKDYQLYIIGHSLGGGVAQMFGSAFKLAGVKGFTVISAAAPKVGNQAYADWVDTHFKTWGRWGSGRDFYRITHTGDLVGLMPVISGYTNPSGEIFLSSKQGDAQVGKDVWECYGQNNRACYAGNTHNAKLPSHQYQRHLDYFVRQGCKELK